VRDLLWRLGQIIQHPLASFREAFDARFRPEAYQQWLHTHSEMALMDRAAGSAGTPDVVAPLDVHALVAALESLSLTSPANQPKPEAHLYLRQQAEAKTYDSTADKAAMRAMAAGVATVAREVRQRLRDREHERAHAKENDSGYRSLGLQKQQAQQDTQAAQQGPRRHRERGLGY
jgi:hypothetical protein